MANLKIYILKSYYFVTELDERSMFPSPSLLYSKCIWSFNANLKTSISKKYTWSTWQKLDNEDRSNLSSKMSYAHPWMPHIPLFASLRPNISEYRKQHWKTCIESKFFVTVIAGQIIQNLKSRTSLNAPYIIICKSQAQYFRVQKATLKNMHRK